MSIVIPPFFGSLYWGMLIYFLSWNLLDVAHSYLTCCGGCICCFRFSRFGHSCLRQWLKCCVSGCYARLPRAQITEGYFYPNLHIYIYIYIYEDLDSNIYIYIYIYKGLDRNTLQWLIHHKHQPTNIYIDRQTGRQRVTKIDRKNCNIHLPGIFLIFLSFFKLNHIIKR